MKTAYLDCFSGVSGDMFLGSLLDAGLPFHELRECLLTLPINGYEIEIKREARNQIFGTRFLVSLDEGRDNHRGLKEIREVIAQGDLSETVKEQSMQIFESLAKVEGEIHNLPPEEVHFHEVGAIDSIIDIVGTVYALDRLDIGSLYVSALPLGSGFVMTAHGKIPVPAPATIAMLKGIPVFEAGISHEMVTPTGAALIKGLSTSFGSIPPMVIREIGYGVGTRDLPDRPNLLRIFIGEEQPEKTVDTVVVLETNVDDISPEWLGYLMDRLFDAGALDVVFFPVQMKKNRPGVQIQVIGRPDKKELLMEIMVRESATLGIRFRYSQRRVLPRSFSEVDSPWGKVKVKKVMLEKGPSILVPEYDVCKEIAAKNNIPLREVYLWVTSLEVSQPA